MLSAYCFLPTAYGSLFRSPSPQRDPKRFEFLAAVSGLLLHPPRPCAGAQTLSAVRVDRVNPVSDFLHRLPSASRHDTLSGAGNRTANLFHSADDAHDYGRGHRAVCDCDVAPSAARRLPAASGAGALDFADVDVRFDHGGDRLLDALSTVSVELATDKRRFARIGGTIVGASSFLSWLGSICVIPVNLWFIFRCYPRSSPS